MNTTRGFPQVNALLPTYNAQPFIETTLAALAAQTYPHLHILIADDASTDATGQICERFAHCDSRARVVRQPHRLGWVGNSNALLKEATGEYAFFAGHDDLIAPSYVERLVGALENDASAVLAYADGERQRLDGKIVEWIFPDVDGPCGRLERSIPIARQRTNWPVAYRGVFRVSAARSIGGLRLHRAGEFGADWPWILAMSLRGRFVRVPQHLFRKVTRPDGLAQNWAYRARDHFGVTLSCIDELRRAGIPWREESRLGAELAWTCVRSVAQALRRRLIRYF